MSRFLDALHSGRVLLMDGAMGTELQRAGLRDGECGELWNLTHPERVRAIHAAYAAAGAEVLLTNTFQANLAALARRESQADYRAIYGAAVENARAASAPGGFVLIDVGPAAGDELPISGGPGVDAVLFETFSSDDIWSVVRAACVPESQLLLISLSYLRGRNGALQTLSGHAPEWFARQARSRGVAALGINCGRDIGLDDTIEIVRRYRAVTDLPLFARPNAGTPTRDGDPHT
jgi:5-methyltetrahydrofolate--homocysteine methyltransferase